jgi:predicted nuclease with TOPRIM domain
MKNINWELLGTIIAVTTLAITMYKTWKSNIQELQKISDKVEANAVDIAKNHDRYQVELEQVKADRADRVRAVYHEIDDLKKLHMKDVNDLKEVFEEAVEKMEVQNRCDHKEITHALTAIEKELTALSATFTEYRKTRNGNTPKENGSK